MKISRKIMISNMIIGFFVTILLSVMILFVANNFIRDNAFYNMEKEISRMIDTLKYRGVDSLFFTSNNNNTIETPGIKHRISTGHVFIVLDSEGNLIKHTDFTYDIEVSDSFYKELHEMDSDQYVNLQLSNYPVVTYKKDVFYTSEEGEAMIQIVGLVYNSLLYKLLFDLMVPVIIALFVVVILSFVVSSFYGKRITEPVESLINMTKKVSQKEVITSNIKSGDEFEVISDALEEMSKALSIKDIESKQFYEHVSHDLKTPLTIISGYAEGVNNGIFESNKEPLDKIVKHCDSLKRQIEDLIFLSQLETKKQRFDLKPTIIEEVVSEILDDFEVIFLKNDIEIIYQPNKETLVNIDTDKIIRAISNIVLNASKYTHSEFSVIIEDLEELVKVSFIDDGPGFSKEVLEYPFMGYYESNESGNGIGLMIVYKIMEAHQGEVKIYNTSKGAVVEIQFIKTV